LDQPPKVYQKINRGSRADVFADFIKDVNQKQQTFNHFPFHALQL